MDRDRKAGCPGTDGKTADFENLLAEAAGALAERGWCVLPGFFPDAMTAALRADLDRAETGGDMARAAIGRAGQRAVEDTVRTDRTLWLDGSCPAQSDYLSAMENVRQALNRTLFLGLFDYECHYAVYAAGGFYRKHVDGLHGVRNRIVSCVTYLTPDWTDADEGWLVLYDPADEAREIARVLPACGTLALFMSETVPHEVLPPRRPRSSIAGWFRCNPSGSGRADPTR